MIQAITTSEIKSQQHGPNQMGENTLRGIRAMDYLELINDIWFNRGQVKGVLELKFASCYFAEGQTNCIK